VIRHKKQQRRAKSALARTQLNTFMLMRTNSTFTTANRRISAVNPIEILIHADGVELTDNLREAVNTKIGRVRQYAPRALRARVRLTKLLAARSQSQYRAHVLYELPGNDVNAEHVAHEPLVAVDIVAEKIERRLRKRKTARLARRIRHSRSPR
jgi:ribosomal subunit interface protein